MGKKRRILVPIILLAAALIFIYMGLREAPEKPPVTYNAERAYLEALHLRGAVGSPVSTFALMAEYLNSKQYRAGIRFFSSLLENNDEDLPKEEKALYLGCLGVLRASYAEKVPLIRRIGWVNETIEILESARELANNGSYGIRWMIGVVYAQLPDRFKKREVALKELGWLIDNAALAPEAGMLREVYFQLASLHHRSGDEENAKSYLARSGYEDFERPIMLVTSFAVNARWGHTFHPRRMVEVLPGRVFALSGFEFTEYYFIVSKNGKELISIDAGTRPDSAKRAYEYLRARHPGLPPLTAVLVTHAHWDHIGGHQYFREVNPDVKFYIRDNYREEFERAKSTAIGFKYFFGSEYSNRFIADFKPHVLVSGKKRITIGGTDIDLIPIPGGETPDGLFIYLPELSTVFVGDFIMPYLGAPFVVEGNLPGLLTAIGMLADLSPEHVLHGHETLTRRFNPPSKLSHLGEGLKWLAGETVSALGRGLGRADIHHLNLIPPSVFTYPGTQFIYLVMRENVINRIVDQKQGYWGWDLSGMDYLNKEDYGSLLQSYLDLSEGRIADVISEMISRGDYDLAVKTATWGITAYPDSEPLFRMKREAFLKLKEKYQFINPFKTIIYSEVTGYEVPQLTLPK